MSAFEAGLPVTSGVAAGFRISWQWRWQRWGRWGWRGGRFWRRRGDDHERLPHDARGHALARHHLEDHRGRWRACAVRGEEGVRVRALGALVKLLGEGVAHGLLRIRWHGGCRKRGSGEAKQAGAHQAGSGYPSSFA